jgi:hypothetical protein
MKRVALIVPVLLLLAGCGNSDKPKTADTVIADSTGTGNTKATGENAVQNIEPSKIGIADLPKAVQFRGNLKEAWQWKDGRGANILVTSYVAPYDDSRKNQYGEEGQSAELHAFHYVKKGEDYELLWKMTDGEIACPFDITCEFINRATSITDLDKDGIAETTLLYRLACRSDVSPAALKLIIYEDVAKYTLKGLSWVSVSPEEMFSVTENDANLETLKGYRKTEDDYMKTFGRYESEREFAQAPPGFITHARREWMKFVKESFE